MYDQSIHDYIILNFSAHKAFNPKYHVYRMAYYLESIVERKSDSRAHDIFVAIKAAVMYALKNVPNKHMIITCNSFRQHMEEGTVVCSFKR